MLSNCVNFKKIKLRIHSKELLDSYYHCKRTNLYLLSSYVATSTPYLYPYCHVRRYLLSFSIYVNLSFWPSGFQNVIQKFSCNVLCKKGISYTTRNIGFLHYVFFCLKQLRGHRLPWKRIHSMFQRYRINIIINQKQGWKINKEKKRW